MSIPPWGWRASPGKSLRRSRRRSGTAAASSTRRVGWKSKKSSGTCFGTCPSSPPSCSFPWTGSPARTSTSFSRARPATSCPEAETTVRRLLAVTALLSFLAATAAAQEALDVPGLIDVHAHIGSYSGYDLSLDNLLRNLSENHVRYAFVSNVDGAAIPNVTADKDETAVNEETARICGLHPQLKPLAWAKPGAPGAGAEKIEPFLRDRGFIGVKFHPEFNFFPADSPAV